jgi:2,4-dienoyl-CoA reductase-like NADH-dependent reductase (Old Yellow Enzyme family)
MQISHSGKQCPISVNTEPISPSSVPLNFNIPFLFRTPREMTLEEIKDTIKRYSFTAKLAKEAGWDGVQIHGAHGNNKN